MEKDPDTRRRAFNLLIATLGVLHAYGWNNTKNRGAQGGFCLLEAMWFVCNGGKSRSNLITGYLPEYKTMEARLEATKVLSETIGTKDLIAWNDDPARKDEEVLNAVAEAADKIEHTL